MTNPDHEDTQTPQHRVPPPPGTVPGAVEKPPPVAGAVSAQPPPPPPPQYVGQGQGAVIGRDPTQSMPPLSAPPPPAQPGAQPAAYGAAPGTGPGAVHGQPVPVPQAPPGRHVQAVPPPPGAATAQPAAWSTTVARPATPGTGGTTGAAGGQGQAQGAVVAAPATAQAPAAVVQADRLAIPDAGRNRPPGKVGGPSNGNGHSGLSGRLARLRIGSHTVSRSALARIRISSSGTGLILGADRNQGPVLVRFFRPASTRITLVGGVWAGQLVAFRALALGARVAVVTSEPYAWQGFGERATGRTDRVAIMTADQPIVVSATVRQPLLVIYDRGVVGGPTASQPLGPWQTQLTILRQLDQSGVSSVQDCDMVMLQRLGSTEAALVGNALRLPAPSTQFLQVMADDMMALVGGGADRYVWLTQTDVERQYAGTPRR